MYDIGETGLASHLSIGRVMEVNPNTFTATVLIVSGRNEGTMPECMIRVISKNTISRSAVIFMPERDDEVYIDWSVGPTPKICDHVTDVVNQETVTESKQKITPLEGFGGQDKFFKNLGGKPYRSGPVDIMPGDKIIMSKLGNFLGVLAGGLTILRGGPLSQIILSKYRDYVKIVARNFELFSDFGVIRMKNKGGKNSFELLGNSTGRKSNSTGETAWDYIFKLGGSNLLDLVLMKDKFQLSINEDGHATIKTAASFSVEMATAPEIKITGDQSVSVDGSKEEFYTGNLQVINRGTQTRKMSRELQVCSGSSNVTIGGPSTKTCLRTFTEVIRGTSITDTTTVGYATRIAAGNYEVTIGDPLDMGTPSIPLAATLSTGGYSLKTFSGDITFAATIKGSFSFSTALGDVSFSTAIGSVGMSTVVGDVTFSTEAGNAGMTTKAGNLDFTTLLGNVVLGTNAGNVEIKATVGGIKLTAGTASIEIGPTGLKITNAGINMMDEIAEMLTNLSTATLTPGFSGPITTAPQFAAQLIKWKLIQGV